MEEQVPKKRGRKSKVELSIRKNLGYELLEWGGVGYWAIRSSVNSDKFLKFEVYLMNRYYWFRLCPDNPFEPIYPDNEGWILEVWAWGGEQPTAILNDHYMLRHAKFDELFSCMTILSQDVGLSPNLFAVSDISLSEIQSRWKNLMKELPEWVKNNL